MVAEEKILKSDRKSKFSSSDLQERRYLWTARVFSVFGIVSIVANIVLIISLLNMTPLIRVEPFLFSFVEKDEQVIEIEPLTSNMTDNDIVTESMVRYYILIRNTLVNDLEIMQSRWGADGPVKWMSSDANYREFSNKNLEVLQKIKQEGLTRNVTIYSIVRLSKDIWQAEIVTEDILPSSAQPVKTKWVVNLRVGYKKDMRVKYSQRLKNPLGFIVQQYMIKRSG